jgi:hypothetical protein
VAFGAGPQACVGASGVGPPQDLGNVRRDGHVASEATILRVLRDEGLMLPAAYQRKRRKLAERRKAPCVKEPTGPNQVWPLDFSEFEMLRFPRTAEGIDNEDRDARDVLKRSVFL